MPRPRPIALAAALCAASFFLVFRLSADERAAAAADEILYVNLVWHQHQPLYYKDPQTGVYTRPWVRVHATKDYYDMAATVAKYPSVHVTFNLTPVLLRQLDDLASGAKDRYQELAEKPADRLTAEEKRFIIERFFDTNQDHVIKRFPRYAELYAERAAAGSTDAALAAFTMEDIRDLSIWFNLAWFDPDALAASPLAPLVAKGRGFEEKDKAVVFSEALRIIKQVIPIHKALQDKGQIEVITTPYAHPILPLLYNTALAAKGDPSAALPDWYSFANDAMGQVARSVKEYEKAYGKKPSGMWPAEGAVAPEIVKMVADAGYKWMASGEQVLAKSLGIGDFTRDSSDTVNEADALYRPYIVSKDGASVAMVFRDQRLSDLIGFEYSGTPGEQAASDLIQRLEKIRARLAAGSKRGPHLVSIILDGENAWEYYQNDGKEFLNALYRKLSESATLRTVTTSEFLKKYPEQKKLDSLWWGAWFSPDYSTWIGEPEENTAWNYLSKVRKDLAEYDVYKRKKIDAKSLERALDYMYLAEGSDWFWWYGADQDSGNDAYFDQSFRALLTGVYTSLGLPSPKFLEAPIISEGAAAGIKPLDGPFTPVIDGKYDTGEWDKAARIEGSGGVMAGGGDALRSLSIGMDGSALYARLEAKEPWSAARTARLYLLWDPRSPSSPFTVNGSVLGFGATAYVEAAAGQGGSWKLSLYRRGRYDQWEQTAGAGAPPKVAVEGRIMEIAVPLELLGEASAGSIVRGRAVLSEGSREAAILPAAGSLEVVLPLVGQAEPFLMVDDPAGDDNGPGSYTYPTDSVFKPGVFDILRFTAAATDHELVFAFQMNAPIDNPWGSAVRLSLQTFDVYIDTDPGRGTGARQLLEGRNATLEKGNGWDYAIWVEGWNQKLLTADSGGKVSEAPGSPVKVTVDGPKGLVVITVPRSLIKADSQPEAWGYAAMVLSQDGYPSPGVRRVRDVKKVAEQWRIGGAMAGANATRIMDLVRAGSPDQAGILSTYTPVEADALGAAGPNAFAQIPLIETE